MKILVVEDDEKLSKILSVALTPIGDVSSALSGEKAIDMVNIQFYDLIVLDLMLGKMSGIDVLKEIRRQYLMPIIILSALSDVDKKIECFKLGADDYMTKPFSREELLVRVESALRRTSGNFKGALYNFKNAEINFGNKMLTIDGKYVEMNRKTYEILEILVRNKEVVLTRQQIYDRVWGYFSDTVPTVIEVNIFKLRKILAEYGLDSSLKTLKGTGYMWTEKV